MNRLPQPKVRPLAAKGQARTIAYAEARSGGYPAKEFCESLDRSVQNQFLVRFQKFADTGKIYNKQHFKIVEGSDLYEFKAHQHRILCHHLPGGILLLLNGCQKKTDKLDKGVIAQAQRIFSEDQLIHGKSQGKGG